MCYIVTDRVHQVHNMMDRSCSQRHKCEVARIVVSATVQRQMHGGILKWTPQRAFLHFLRLLRLPCAEMQINEPMRSVRWKIVKSVVKYFAYTRKHQKRPWSITLSSFRKAMKAWETNISASHNKVPLIPFYLGLFSVIYSSVFGILPSLLVFFFQFQCVCT